MRVMTRFLLAFLLVFSSIECVASCVSEDCGSPKAPPCHDSAPSVKACPHELVIERAQSVVNVVEIAPLLAPVSLNPAPVTTEFVPEQSAVGPAPPLSLRI